MNHLLSSANTDPTYESWVAFALEYTWSQAMAWSSIAAG